MENEMLSSGDFKAILSEMNTEEYHVSTLDIHSLNGEFKTFDIPGSCMMIFDPWNMEDIVKHLRSTLCFMIIVFVEHRKVWFVELFDSPRRMDMIKLNKQPLIFLDGEPIGTPDCDLVGEYMIHEMLLDVI